MNVSYHFIISRGDRSAHGKKVTNIVYLHGIRNFYITYLHYIRGEFSTQHYCSGFVNEEERVPSSFLNLKFQLMFDSCPSLVRLV